MFIDLIDIMQMKFLTPSSRPDNFLLEMELAVRASRNNTMAIYPLLVGTVHADGSYQKFDPTTFRYHCEFTCCL